jgi:hypothetical protein
MAVECNVRISARPLSLEGYEHHDEAMETNHSGYSRNRPEKENMGKGC